jgi:uncharacterized protein (TIGR02271 family)
MPTIEDVKSWRGRHAVDRDGDRIGEIVDIYLDEETDQPEWLAIKTGLVGSRVSFAPIAEATSTGDDVRVPYEKAQVKDAPNAEPDGALSQDEEARLYAHYGLSYGESRSDSGLPEGGRPQTDDAMTRSEEELRVGKTSREVGKARLKKYIVTEQVQTTVPVQREEVRIEREPITDANAGNAMDGPALSEEEHEVTLHAEQAVVDKTVVPKERVRLDKETHVEEQQVSEEVRKERIEAEGDV